MKSIISVAVVITTCLPVAINLAEARGGGKFLGALLGRGASQAAGNAATTYAAKSYGADILSVSQLASCLRHASGLDSRSEAIEVSRPKIEGMSIRVEKSAARVEAARSVLDNRSQYSVDKFNVLVDQHNSLLGEAKMMSASFNSEVQRHNSSIQSFNLECGKRYYETDLGPAKQLAGIQ